MVLSLSALGESIGSMKQWLPPTTGLAGSTLPQGWLILDGSTVADASSPYNTITLPDSRAKFKRGHNSITNASFPTDNAYKAGGTIPAGGADSNNLTHSHAYGFNINHQHTLSGHAHSISSDGDHSHGGTGGAVFNNGSPLGAVANGGAHSHGAITGTPNQVNTSTMNSNDQQNGSVNNGLGATENRPVYQEFVTIIKVK